MRIAMLLCLGLAVLAVAPARPMAAQNSSADSPLYALPYTPGLDAGFMDTSADPCVDFYQ